MPIDALLRLDASALTWVVGSLRHPALDPVMLGLSAAGYYGLGWVVIHALLCIRAPERGAAVMAFWRLVLSLALAVIVVDYLLKPLIARPRPFVLDPSAIPLLYGAPSSFSFPSGHAAMACAGALALSVAWPRLRPLWWLLGLAIAFSRVYLGVHYPLDVLGGAVAGLACAGFATALTPATTAPAPPRGLARGAAR